MQQSKNAFNSTKLIYEISKAILTATLTMDIGSSGSYGATEVYKEMLGYIGIADQKLVELGINKLLSY
ncbi:MAG: DUF935 domain-containing protein [Bacteroidetes bacterium]|nr:DUF935 domain-containing protein [Bacteroidota bacterium]MBU1677390.1 DUF935 domain-containing protein [Bacteroidota bacterium]MBU2508319.1 DUF935 domain-containing protein [Bacteroidota bacterium]